MALNINGRMKVKTLRADFKKEFGLTLRVYDGRSFADDDATLASIRKGDSTGGEFAPQRNTKVGNLEDKIMDMFGLKTQVAGSDDSYLCENDHTLAKALEVDEKLMVKRDKRGNKPDANTESNSDPEDDKDENLTDTTPLTIVMGIHEMYKSDYESDYINLTDNPFSVEIPNELLSKIDIDKIFEMFKNDEYEEEAWVEYNKLMSTWVYYEPLMKNMFEVLWPIAQNLSQQYEYEDEAESHIYSVKLNNREIVFYKDHCSSVFDECGESCLYFGGLWDGNEEKSLAYQDQDTLVDDFIRNS